MKTLSRRGNTEITTYGIIDNLMMTYAGNQLIKVEDAGVNVSLSASMDFKNNSNTAREYEYNKNGGLTKDLNKGISNISYNLLNLPCSLSISNSFGSATNKYVYAADGWKLNADVSGKKTDYCGNVIYENNTLKRILIEGGYIEGGTYYFYLTDHLGNNRVVANGSGTIVQSNHYYPYGMSFTEGTQTSSQPHKFGGKELDTQKRLNLYDFSARMQDPVVPGFTTPDPMSEDYYSISPYAYCAGNPMKFVDPTGMWIQYSDSTGMYRYNNGQWEQYQTSGANIGQYTAYTPAAGSFMAGVLTGLNQLGQTNTGSSLLTFFANDKNNAFIRPSNKAKEENEANIADSAIGEIYLKKTFTGSDIPTENGIQTSPFWLDIGHELAHRQDVINNGSKQAGEAWLTHPDTGQRIPRTDKYATHMENYMRSEAGLPLRTHYVTQGSGGWEPSRILNVGIRTSKFFRIPETVFGCTVPGVVPIKY